MEEGNRDPQDLAARLGDEVGLGLFPAHQGHLAEGIAPLELAEHLAPAPFSNDGDAEIALEQHAEKARVLSELDHRLVRFAGNNPRPLHHLIESIGRQMLKEGHAASEKARNLSGCHRL